MEMNNEGSKGRMTENNPPPSNLLCVNAIKSKISSYHRYAAVEVSER
jgi:hypothetical protein